MTSWPGIFWEAVAVAHCWAPATPRPLFACVTGRLHFFDLLHDLIEIVTRRILQWRVVVVGLQLLLAHTPGDRQHVPVILVSGGWRSNRSTHSHECLDLLANRNLEGITLDVDHLSPVVRDHARHEARRRVGYHREIHFPVLVADRRRILAGIVEECVTR